MQQRLGTPELPAPLEHIRSMTIQCTDKLDRKPRRVLSISDDAYRMDLFSRPKKALCPAQGMFRDGKAADPLHLKVVRQMRLWNLAVHSQAFYKRSRQNFQWCARRSAEDHHELEGPVPVHPICSSNFVPWRMSVFSRPPGLLS